ncbi:MAG: signal peptidase II [Candidatus Magasanikbacteria bacterium]
MKKQSYISLLWALYSFFLLSFDQFLKYCALKNPDFQYTFFHNFLGWEYYPNMGIAFSILVPNWLILLLSPFLLLFICLWYIKMKKNNTVTFGFYLLFFGAVSNYIDRVLQGYTVDYIRFFTSILNIADVMIALGVVFLYFGSNSSRGVKGSS